MAGFGETAALREGSQRVKHHVFLESDSWERFVVDQSEASVRNRKRPKMNKLQGKGSATVKREGAAVEKTMRVPRPTRAMGYQRTRPTGLRHICWSVQW
jgi:hypothetical protein